MKVKFSIPQRWYCDVLPGDGYSLRKVKGQEDTGEVSVAVKSVLRVGGIEECAQRLVSIWLAMPEHYRKVGFHWYDESHEFAVDLADVYDHTVWQVAQVIAVLSPQNPWAGRFNKDGEQISDGNRLCTVKVLEAWRIGGEAEVRKLKGWGYAPDFLSKAIKVLQGEELDWSTAPKTYRFAMLIANPKLLDIAVIDSHASRIATGNLGNRYHVVMASAYKLLEEAYMLAGRILGIPASVLQAGTWQFAVDGGLY